MPDLTARSVVLSVLLGAHPARARASELVRLTSDFGIKESTLRVALTRMVGAGDLVRNADGYQLGSPTRPPAAPGRCHRPARASLARGVGHPGRDQRGRRRTHPAALRNAMHDKRFGELREGVWMRPDNLDAELGPDVTARVRVLRARDGDPAELAAQLWDLPAWARAGHRLLDDMAAAPDIPGRFVVAAATVRHLLTDPVLPDELLPADWPGARLRAAYHDFAAELLRRREPLCAEAR